MVRKLLLSLFFVLLITLVVSKFGSQVALAQFAFEQAFGVKGIVTSMDLLLESGQRNKVVLSLSVQAQFLFVRIILVRLAS